MHRLWDNMVPLTYKIDFTDLSNIHAPILNLCRKLIQNGCSPEDRLECYRGDRLDLIIHNIGKAAELTVEDTRFKHRPERVRASYTRFSNLPATLVACSS